MTIFWLVCACLVAGALFLLLPPVLLSPAGGPALTPRDANRAVGLAQLAELDDDVEGGTLGRERYASSRSDVERAALAEPAGLPPESAAPRSSGRWAAAVIGLAVPLGAVALYLHLGSPGLVAPGVAVPPGVTGAHEMDMARIQQMVDGLARRLVSNPADADGWIMLAKSSTVLGRFAEADNAYGRAERLRPGDAQLLADHADVVGMLQGKRLAGAPAVLIGQALKADPQNMKALALAGTEAYERGAFTQAAEFWDRLRKLVPPGSELEGSVQANVEEARMLAAGRGPSSSVKQPDPGMPPASARIDGIVRISPAVAARAEPDATVFIFARAADGPRMPLAIVRRHVRDLPADFVLDDSTALAPGLRLSGFRHVVVGARVSASGNATSQPGDLEGAMLSLPVGAAHVEITIDRVVP